MLDSDRMTDSFKNRINNRTKQNEKKARQSNRCALHTQWILHLPIFCFFFSKTFIFSSPLIFFFFKEGIYIIREKTKKYEKSGGTRVWKTIFLYLDFDSWILFFFSRVRLLPSQILFFEISFSHFGKLEKVERRHNTKEKTEIVENKITKQNL